MATISSALDMYDSMSGSLKSTTQSMSLLISGTQQMQKVTGNTLNINKLLIVAKKQVVSAEANIGGAIEEAEKSQEKLNNSVKEGKKNTNSLLSGVKAVAAAFKSAKKLAELSIGGAMEQQRIQESFSVRSGSSAAGEDIYKNVTQQALKYKQDANMALSGTMSFMSGTTDTDQLMQLSKLAMRLSKLNPSENLEGAASSMKELMAGDYTSIAEHFNIDKSMLEGSDAVKAGLSGDMDAFIAGMDEMLNSQQMTEEAFEKMMDSPAAKWEGILQTFSFNLSQAGQNALNELAPLFDSIEQSFENGDYQALFEGLSKGLAAAASTAYRLYEIANSTYMFIAENWSAIGPIIWGIAGAVAAWTIATEIHLLATKESAIATFAHAIATKGLKAAWQGLNAAMKANVIIFVISLLAALAIWIIKLWKTNDNFAAGVMRTWNSILSFFDKIPAYFWQLVEWMMQPFALWAKSIGKIYDIVINGIIDGINAVLKLVNRVTGSSYEISARFSMEEIGQSIEGYARVKKDEAYANAAVKAAEREQKVLDMLEEREALRAAQEETKTAAVYENESKKIDTVNNVEHVNDTVDVSSEDLKTMRELAEMKSIQNFVTLKPTVSMTHTGDIKNGYDIETIKDRITASLEEEIASSAAGVF